MPFVILMIGIALAISAYRGTHRDLGSLLASDFSGPNNFFVWIASIIGIGAIGYYKPLQGVTRGFIGLILLVLILATGEKKGLFKQFVDAISNLQASPESASQKANEGPSAESGGNQNEGLFKPVPQGQNGFSADPMWQDVWRFIAPNIPFIGAK